MRIRHCALFIVALLAPVAGLTQEVAGRVLVAAGSVIIERSGQRIAAQPGTELRAGDLLQVGAQSNAQLRLTDESIIALRADTTFRLTEYAFQGRKPEEQRSFFELAKGGMRTVTGIIGRLNQRGYGVTTPTATVGIRGTHYVLYQSPPAGNKTSQLGVKVASLGSGTELLAQASPTPPPGTLFGSVTDGAISVTNQTGEFVFGADQYFRVDRPDTAPQRLIAPPVELAQAARPAPKPKPAAAAEAPAAEKPAAEKPAATAPSTATGGESATTVAQTGMGATTGDTRVSSSVTNPTVPLVLSPTVVLPSEQATTQGASTFVQPTAPTGTKFYRLDGGVVLPAIGDGSPTFITVDFISLGVNLGLGVARMTVGIRGDDNGAINISVPLDIPITVSGGQITFAGSANRADFPNNQLGFRCQTCGPGGTVGFVDTVSVSGTISGTAATVTLSATDPGGGGSFTATLTERTPPNTFGAATVVPRLSGGSTSMVTSTFGVQTDTAGLPTFLSSGLLRATATSAPVLAGNDPTAGDLKWGIWPSATYRDADYNAPAGANLAWIIGQFPNAVPVTLGSSVTYTPVGSLLNNFSAATLNSGSINANFVARTVSINLDASQTSGNLNRFVMSGSSTFSPITASFGAGFSSVSCVSGNCNGGAGTPGGSFGGFFAGPNAEGAGVAFSVGYGVAGQGIGGVVAFKR